MESTQFDIDFLAKETFALSEALRMDGNEHAKELLRDNDFILENTEDLETEVCSDQNIEIIEEVVEDIIEAEIIEPDEIVEAEVVNELPPLPPIEFTHYSFFPDVIESMPEIPMAEEIETVEIRENESYSEYEVHVEEEHQETEACFFNEAVGYPTGPGIVFRLDAGVATFCVKGISTPNIADSFHLLDENNEEIYKELKVQSEEDRENILFFETKTIELADAIRENLINRRFPIEEDSVCNISDPGFSWWFNESNDGFQIYFKSHGLNRAQKYIRLGPIGDCQLATMRFKQAETLIRSFFPVNEFACTDKVFSLSTAKSNHLSYRILKDMFVNGINETTMDQFPASSLGRMTYNYFQEIATLRGFWIYLEDLLKSKNL